ncbi:succinylglutamate desuccinylase/aspartoacylase family protein [Deefgea piscis]|uniref:Succinylglutamate desuccinylase/aspartoacylase family protein n=1 Tax=Deefgea piscis TaxID=2739061 RepID=A0A6M8SSI0_9NEIS|nr:succinylglutamate desuccinylase/aspartoacylase family protein [Deefgea piscis]QKJ66286.1 succinylglutamate desuccinylase/aspartoacylase family protein [Deefgea piscis]
MTSAADLLPYQRLHLKSFTYSALDAGPSLIVLGAVHGNEDCGTKAIARVMAELDSGALHLLRGRITFVPITNPLAFEKQQRNGDRNLNRNLRITDEPLDFEDRIANALCPLLADHDVLLDLHSTNNPGEAFIMLGPENNQGDLQPFSHAEQEEALAVRLGPHRIVEGWLCTYAEGVKHRLAYTPQCERSHLLNTDPSYGVGTTEYMRAHGGYSLTLECGQHTDISSPEVAYQGIRNTIAHLQLADLPAAPVQTDIEFLKISRVIDRHHADDVFVKTWASFDPVQAGEVIGLRHDGQQELAPCDGFVLFPNPSAVPGNEWFYFAQLSERQLSALRN